MSVTTTTRPEPVGLPPIEPHRLYRYEEIAAYFSAEPRQVRRWVEEVKLDFTPLPGGRGRRISGQQYLDSIKTKPED